MYYCSQILLSYISLVIYWIFINIHVHKCDWEEGGKFQIARGKIKEGISVPLPKRNPTCDPNNRHSTCLHNNNIYSVSQLDNTHGTYLLQDPSYK